MAQKIQKVLVANRGEIAIRVFRAVNDLGLHTVAIYSKEDESNVFRIKADESYLVGKGKTPLGAYLDIPGIIQVAKEHEVDAIHPGYGFLSENPDFAKACEDAGIIFIGPPSDVIRQMGDKLSAKEIAVRSQVATIPGSTEPLKNAEEAIRWADQYGYPIILKAAAGGGGKGMRKCQNASEISMAFDLVQSEAEKAFGCGDIFIERFLENPKHIEVQILADQHGNVVHLHERDCSLQRRYQKVVEYTPAFSLPVNLREKICEDAVKIAKEVGYVGAGTVEFLVDSKTAQYFFIEMNPRIQVEHTVTEMVTGIDIVRSQILIAEGKPLSTPEIGISTQEDIQVRGYAIQCRITTEDPKNNFAPDTGKITAYRTGGGFGIRLDGGNAYVGAVISPYYDSLLVKVTTFDRTFDGAVNKAKRTLNETRIRGVKTNIGFIENILSNETFLSGQCHTKFIDETPELFDIRDSQDRATKLLQFIGDIIVNDPKAGTERFNKSRLPKVTEDPKDGLKQMLDTQGPEAVSKWVLGQKKLLLTDTTMRDAHQSLLMTRLRSKDMIRAAAATADAIPDAFSLEMWGGATFDVAYRFLKESPWDRLEKLREKIPNIPFQMLLRGANAIGYTNYPDNVIRAFIQESANRGIDVFRIFDSLNWLPGMEIAIDEALKTGKLVEGTICYTGDCSDPKETKWTIEYYVSLAKQLEQMGVHLVAIKDMAGLLKPYAAKELVTALKSEISVPIHLHTHDSSGNQIATYMLAAEAGVDIVDVAFGSLAGGTSQPAMDSLVASLKGQPRDTGFDLDKIQKMSQYWGDVRKRYDQFESNIQFFDMDIYRYEIPGGQYTNLRAQVESLGLSSQFEEVKEMYHSVNEMLGGLVKVTPSSKMVGDMAIFMVQNKLTAENILEKGKNLAFPDSVVTYFKGMMGQPAWGFPKELQDIVLKGEKPITCRPGELLEPVDFDKVKDRLIELEVDPTWKSILSWCFYPKVYEDYLQFQKEYGNVSDLGSHVFFHGLDEGETHRVEIEDGKTLVIKYMGRGEINDDGTVNIIFQLNGVLREVPVFDKTIKEVKQKVKMADPKDEKQIGAPIPGMISQIKVKEGDRIEKNQVLLVVEAMKMETSLSTPVNGVVKAIHAEEGKQVKGGELLIEIE